MKWYEVILISLGMATLTLIEAICAAAYFEGAHYVVSLRHHANFVSLWITYAWIFGACGVIGWLVSGAFRWQPRLGRPAALHLVLLMLSLPLLIAPLKIRAKLEVLVLSPTGLLVGGAALLVVLGWLAFVSFAGKPGLFRATAWALLLAVAVLGIADCFVLYQLAPQILSPKGLGALGLASLAACLLSVPLLLALRNAHARPVARPLAAALGGVAAVLVAIVYLTPQQGASADTTNQPGIAGRPSVLLIVVDTLRSDFVLHDGEIPENVPNLRALAEDAVLFEQTFATAPWTTASFGSILSSTYPSEHRAGAREPRWSFKSPMTDSVTCLAETMAGRGYWTGAVLTNPYLGPRFGLNRGFEAYEDLIETRWYHPVFYGVPIRVFMQWQDRLYIPARPQTARIERMVRRARASGRPFFVLAHYMDPHIPYAAPERFGGGAPGKSMFDAYRDEVSYFDHYLGKLVQDLKQMGLYDDLLIVLTSDHGEELVEERLDAAPGTRRRDHGHTLFNELIHVPLLIKWPGNERGGARRSELVSLLDIAPTLVARAGLVVPSAFRGRVIHEDPGLGLGPGLEVIFAEGMLYGPEQKAAIEGRRKVILPELPFSVEDARAYDLAADPAERQPLALTEAPEEFRTVTNALFDFVETQVPLPGSEAIEPDPLLRQQLEALGYTH